MIKTSGPAIILLYAIGLGTQPVWADDEATLWAQISAKREAAENTPPATGSESFSARAQQYRQRLALISKYHTLYPGGVHRAAGIALELETRFQLGLLEKGDLSGLCERVSTLLAREQIPAVEAEAAYWRLICDEHTAVSQPPDGFPDFSAKHLAAREAYLRQYPHSRHTPRLLNHLFNTAWRQQRWTDARRIAELAQSLRPELESTQRLRARIRRHEAIGQRFPLLQDAPPDAQAVFRAVESQNLLIVVWAGFDEGACELVREIETWRRTRPNVRIVGVNLDSDRSRMTAATSRLNINWPQIHDGRGWDTWFAAQWDVRFIPRVFVIDRNGRLLGVADDKNWRPLAQRLPNSNP